MTFQYYLIKFLSWLASPLGIFFILVLLSLIALVLHQKKTTASMMAFSVLWLWVWSMPWTNHALRLRVEQKYVLQSMQQIPTVDAIVVLGGGVNPPATQQRSNALRKVPDLLSASDRVWFAAKLYKEGKAPLIVLSGGHDPQRYLYSEAEAMALFIQDLGVPTADILLEPRSLTTRENARLTAQLLKERRVHTILLVTSAWHMQRAHHLFKNHGFTIYDAPTDFEALEITEPNVLDFLPSPLALDGSSKMFKETLALALGY